MIWGMNPYNPSSSHGLSHPKKYLNTLDSNEMDLHAGQRGIYNQLRTYITLKISWYFLIAQQLYILFCHTACPCRIGWNMAFGLSLAPCKVRDLLTLKLSLGMEKETLLLMVSKKRKEKGCFLFQEEYNYELHNCGYDLVTISTMRGALA